MVGLREKMEVWQKDLIDVSKRNNLLYYKTQGRTSGIQLIAKDLQTLFRTLTSPRQSFVLDIGTTSLDEDEHDKRLRQLKRRVHEDLDSRGMSTLYAAFGLLEWYEADASNEANYSPLVLVPVELVGGGVLQSLALRRLGDEDIEINPTLREKIAHDYGVRIPTYTELQPPAPSSDTSDREAPTATQAESNQAKLIPRTINDTLRQIADALPPAMRAKVLYEAHLGRFSFQKLALYQDLRKNEEMFQTHPLLRAIAGDRGALPRVEGLVRGRELDTIAPHLVREVLDADSSQQEAIVAAKAGASFVLQGPPGTGKSQTITNIIAECIGQGKRVLFVSEKMAALQVVFQRLQEVGLADYCLNLHNPSADKKPFLADIEKSVHQARSPLPASPATWLAESTNLAQARDQLNTYVRELHTSRTALGWSAFRVLGELAALRDVHDHEFAIDQPDRITPTRYEQMVQTLRALMEYGDVLDALDTHPWRAIQVTSYSLTLESDIRAHFTPLTSALRGQEGAVGSMRGALDEDQALVTLTWARHAQSRMQYLLDGPRIPRHWLLPDAPARLQAVAAPAEARCALYATAAARLDPRYSRAVLAEDIEAVLSALTTESAPGAEVVRASESRDCLLAHRDMVTRQLADATAALRALPESAADLARDFGQSPPETLEDIAALLRVASCLQRTPAPPQRWLDPAGLAEARACALEAESRYRASAQARADLMTRYEEAFLALPTEEYRDRYRQYGSALRFVNVQWYRDRKAIQAVTRPDVIRTVQQVEADLAVAAKYAADMAWLREHQTEHARILGEFFDGERTDWERLRAGLAWTADYHNCLKDVQSTPQITQLATGATKGAAAMRRHAERLRERWDAWQRALQSLDDLLDVEQVANGLVEEAEPQQLATALDDIARSWARLWWGSDTLARHATPDRLAHGGGTWEALCADARQIREMRDALAWLAGQKATLEADLGPGYVGTATNWEEMRVALRWTSDLLALYPDALVPDPVKQLVALGGGDDKRQAMRAALTEALAHDATVRDELTYAEKLLPLSVFAESGAALDDTLLADIRSRVETLLAQLPQLSRWLGFQEQVSRCRELGLGSMMDVVLRGRIPFTELDKAFQRRFFLRWLDVVRDESVTLRLFDGRTQERLIQRFRELDEQHTWLGQKQLNHALAYRRASAFEKALEQQGTPLAQAAADLQREIGKKRHASIRTIVRKTTPALLDLKPCWLMSPLSISQYLEDAGPIFDVVIFDEASQVCPEDAICAIARGKQLIVVGDRKQLPPTRFFSKTFANDGDEDEEEETAESGRTESILDECWGAASFAKYGLKWHYRSQHESLIAFSNHHFYDDSLVTFPSPSAQSSGGVRWEYVEGAVYSGKSSCPNPKETQRVVDLIFDYAQQGHNLNDLGVVALSQAHQNAILDAIETRLKQQPELQAWQQDLDGGKFFVKNLESVQGDEREVIILSICYGPDSTGRVYRRFGPVGLQGGERRLNVAMTRARRQLIVVSSMKAKDLDQGGELTNIGARVLRDFLEYAEHGPEVLGLQGASAGTQSTDAFDSPFEQAVYEALIARGISLDTQVGCSGYRIDLAVRDPERPGKHILGIECDGAMYHSSQTARDRDRLRQRQLERMGWTIHRIWSSDWWRNPDGEVRRVLDKLTEQRTPTEHAPAREAAPVAMTPSPARPASASDLRVSSAETTRAVEPVLAPRQMPQVVPQPRADTRASGDQGERKIIQIGRADRVCEQCLYLQRVTLTATQFRCGLDQTMKRRAPGGVTRGCDAWKRQRA